MQSEIDAQGASLTETVQDATVSSPSELRKDAEPKALDAKSSDGMYTLERVIESKTPTEFIANVTEMARILPQPLKERYLELARHFAGWAAKEGLYYSTCTIIRTEEEVKYQVFEHLNSKVKLPQALLRADPDLASHLGPEEQLKNMTEDEHQQKLGAYLVDDEGEVYPGYRDCMDLNFTSATGEKLFMRYAKLLSEIGAHQVIRD